MTVKKKVDKMLSHFVTPPFCILRVYQFQKETLYNNSKEDFFRNPMESGCIPVIYCLILETF